MRNLVLLMVFLILAAGALAGCSGADQQEAGSEPAGEAQEAAAPALAAAMEGELEAESYTSAVLVTSYEGALPAGSQLALGIFRLQDTEKAVTTEQARVLLPLWQAIQGGSLQGDTETNAVLKQIEGAMTADQLAAIAAMQLTRQDLGAWMQEQGVELGPGPGAAGGLGRFAEMSEEEREAMRATRQAGGGGGLGQGRFAGMSEEERSNMRATAEAGGFTPGSPGGPAHGMLTVLAEPLVELLTNLSSG
ncbi:MAG: hypothetical protein PVF77_14340 [Anaerolineae bacterium]